MPDKHYLGLLNFHTNSSFFSFTMASDDGENKFSYDVDARSVEGQSPSPNVHTDLHRKLKNRHIAMIRCISLRPYPTFSSPFSF